MNEHKNPQTSASSNGVRPAATRNMAAGFQDLRAAAAARRLGRGSVLTGRPSVAMLTLCRFRSDLIKAATQSRRKDLSSCSLQLLEASAVLLPTSENHSHQDPGGQEKVPSQRIKVCGQSALNQGEDDAEDLQQQPEQSRRSELQVQRSCRRPLTFLASWYLSESIEEP